jgi:lipopolysaccharide transport system ATP-binding protein
MLQLGKRNGRQRQAPQKFEALRDVSFELRPGEVAGVVGRNGAGKSTLLKLLSRISAPTQGRIEIRGRLASLLEVGTGFHPELSGRENVYLNGAILGMKRAEVSRKFDEIVAFAEIDKFVDTPVKHYSSGMYVRLAFAVAAHLETDVLLVDEVLAVGDASFQRKSLGKMSDVAKGGRTVLFVSHNLGAVRNLCSRALLLEGGRLSFDGNVEEGLALYETSFSTGMGLAGDARFDGSLSDSIRFDQLICRQNNDVVGVIDPMREFQLEVHGAALAPFSALELKIGVFRDGLHLASCYDTPGGTGLREGRFVSAFHFPPDVFKPGRYTLGMGASGATGDWLWGSDIAVLDFCDNRGNRPHDVRSGMVSIPYQADRQQ